VRINPGAIEFTAPVGGPVTPASVPLQLTSKIGGLTFTATRTTVLGGNWLSISPASGSIPGTINVTGNAAGLAAGVYTGVIDILVHGGVSEHHVVPATLLVGIQNQTARLAVQPGVVVFQAAAGGANPAPAPVTLDARGAASIPFSATMSTASGGNWLSVSKTSGTAPIALTVSANVAGLSSGMYSGAVVFQASGPAALPATLNVVLVVHAAGGAPAAAAASAADQLLTPSAAGGIFLEPGTDFSWIADSPHAVSAMLFAADLTPLEGADVQVFPSSGESPFTLEDAGGGLYTGSFQSLTGGPVALTAVAAAGSSSVSFSVGGDVDGSTSARPVIFQGGILSAANFAPAPTPIAPGAIVSLFGTGLADSVLSASGFPLPADLGGTKVLVGGVEAPLIGVVPDAGDGYDQINFQAPVELSALSFADVVVLHNGVFSGPRGIAIAPAVPAFFTLNSQGNGAAKALHGDFSLITADSPARAGEAIIVYATGLGDVQPAAVSGQPAGNNSRVTGNWQIMIGGSVAKADFVGLAPGSAGVYQINVTVPDGTASGDAAIGITINGISSSDGVTISVGG
jgi:uncharacterized protein (TIGR03437 family)